MMKPIKDDFAQILAVFGIVFQEEVLMARLKLWLRNASKRRANRDFATADRIRDELVAQGIKLLDTKDGVSDPVTKAVDVNPSMVLPWLLKGCGLFHVYPPPSDFSKGKPSSNQIHRLATHYVSAKAQAMLITLMLEETCWQKKSRKSIRGRNANANTKAKNTDIITYKMSTGFEAVIGYLHMTEQTRAAGGVDWLVYCNRWE